jgi:hypothetical protein
MIATFVNVFTVILGGIIGVTFGNRIGEKYSKGLMTAIGLITFTIGIQNVMCSNNTLIVVVCLILGTLLGMLLKLDDKINASGEWLKGKLSHTKFGSGRFGEAFVTCTILFCVGTMTILGSIQAGLNHDYTIILTKSVMDFVSCLAFSAALGPGAIFACIPVLVVQGTITLLASAMEPILTTEVIAEMSAVGGAMFLGMAINLLGLREEPVKVGDMLPAIFLPILYFPLAHLLGIG